MTQKTVHTFDVWATDTVRIRWFLSEEKVFYDEEYTCPPLETRKARKNDNNRLDESIQKQDI